MSTRLFSQQPMVVISMRAIIRESSGTLQLCLNEFRSFFNELWAGDETPRKIDISMKESFLNWLSEKTGTDIYEITRESGQTLENLFNEIETEYGEVSGEDLDPRYIHLFLIS